MSRAALVAALALACSGCRHFGFQDHPVPIDRDEIVAPDGVRYEELFVGRGAIAAQGDVVLLDYTVWLADGSDTRVDSTLDRGVPVRVTIGSAFVDGLDSGLIGVQPNGRRRIHVPSRQAYGSKGVPDMVPPDADLVFDVHVLEVHPHAP